MSLELELTFSLDRPGKPEKTVVSYQLPPDVTVEQVSDIIKKTHGFMNEIIFKYFDFKGEKHGG
ncbi:hypothetical protein ABM58_002991 [Salmonella enterica subsp. enterica]|nr:hypothetical protein [Salmonella enterica subsp. enterica serovar Manchester]ECN1279260.1 hypothetical protein [Salmonella enterica subsp. enterica serovar Typhimurium]EDG5395808.1 hypothetical protein [Salmonella enterica subsp. enterica serovar Bovismorbificans]EEA7773364.1 hypothetical protein [Salmonella enterica subsp. enterica serovar Manchester]